MNCWVLSDPDKLILNNNVSFRLSKEKVSVSLDSTNNRTIRTVLNMRSLWWGLNSVDLIQSDASGPVSYTHLFYMS